MGTGRFMRGRWRAATGALAVAAALSACTTGPSTRGGPPADVAGEWTGELDPANTVPGGQRLPLGQVHLSLGQSGGEVRGRLTAQGLQGSVSGEMSGSRLSGVLEGTALGQSFSRPLQATARTADTLDATLGGGVTFTLTRVSGGAGRPVTLQNPRTMQVMSCRGSARAVESCVASLEIDGWRRLGP
ncbi:MAG TPA: hypothetical protein VMT79_08055 [Candidatus Binatia bacterium]|nr:hypothetical protein [Candidatus Binatia bacterium]